MLEHLDLFEQVPSTLEVFARLRPLFLDVLEYAPLLHASQVFEDLHTPRI